MPDPKPYPAWLPLVAVLCNVLMALFGVGLMVSSGHLLSRSALHPESLLLLMPIITTVRFFGLGRAVLRYLERLFSHQVTLGRIESTRRKAMQQHLVHFTYRLLGPDRLDAVQTVQRDTESLQNRFLTVSVPQFTTWTVTLLVGLLLLSLVPGAALVWFAVSGAVLLVMPLVIRPLLQRLLQQVQEARHARSLQLRTQLQHATELRFLDLPISQKTSVLEDNIQKLESQLRGLQTSALLVREVMQGTALGLLLLQLLHSDLPVVWLSGIWLGVVAASDLQVAFLNSLTEQVRVSLIQWPQHSASDQPSMNNTGLNHTGAVLKVKLSEGQTFTLQPGGRIMLTGPSGCGKSTLLEKLLGFRELTSGEAVLDHQDLSGLAGREKLFSWSPQEPQLQDATVQENLGSWNAALLESLHLPADLRPDTLLGETGRHLSGGEMARLQVLRALLREAPFLLLDEPTAHLDPGSALQTIQTIEQAAGNRAMLVISHDPELFGSHWQKVDWIPRQSLK
ncbi:ATP-binding cassette domain-containing protein [Deinococcus roseus]|uniref:Cysteine/glutathione ABC transporter ATP-binding protein/permease CydC n=1 Tax=Deinococcus roseus TaxID=392414 RepID=A0ABQ2CWV3_9DEIO|nr:ATP-binding cassette domain-containing protein [Deinococcus roseus]GGJ28785.1 cysteine/glutathione ABC transporter ATP-binding protein/permease CydC [Deinococcus roseus]